ncbi:hypothetical protein [Saccharopolyspora hattusasensis]|uniref:hypothetical protein n=1 Tax=Saccharopolyspora hattusasensis TaxID=1128679 RepID=UPI003D98F9E3
MTEPRSAAGQAWYELTKVEGELDWRELWELRGPDPVPLSEAANDLIRLSESGQWWPSDVDRAAGFRVIQSLRWTEDRPLGPAVGEVCQTFAEVLREPLSEPVRRVLTEAARWEPKAPKPGTWKTMLYAVLTGDIEP